MLVPSWRINLGIFVLLRDRVWLALFDQVQFHDDRAPNDWYIMTSDESTRLWIVLTSGFFSLLFVFFSLRRFRRRAILRAMPTTPIGGVFVGDVEIKGKAAARNPVIGYLCESPCVCFSWSISEHWTRQRTVTSTDSKGKTTTKVVTDHGSDVVADSLDQTALEVEDDTGRILVHWEGAKVEQETLFYQVVNVGEPLYYGKGPVGSVSGSNGVRTFSEYGIRIGTPLFVVGYARQREDIVDVEIANGGRKGTATEGAEARLFLISTRNEAEVTSGHGIAGWFYAIIGFLAVACLLIIDAADDNGHLGRKFPWYFAIGFASFCMVFALAWFVWMFNELIDLRNRVVRAASNIDVQLKRRADLIRGLVECAVAIRDHEGRLQKAIAFLRAQATLENRKSAHGNAKVALPMIDAIIEAYPNLKSGEVFLRLQVALSDAEQRIALARDEFNGTAAGYNTRISEFPSRIVATFALMHRANFFEATTFERIVPTVRTIV